MDVPKDQESDNALKLLVVDDEEPIRFAMREYFQPHGYEVDCAADPTETALLLNEKCYAVAIVDLCLTVVDGTEGLQVVELMRERCPETKIVVLTAYGSAEVVSEAAKRGVDAFLHKPMPLHEIEKIVSELTEPLT